MITMRVTPREKDAIELLARREGMSVARLVRALARRRREELDRLEAERPKAPIFKWATQRCADCGAAVNVRVDQPPPFLCDAHEKRRASAAKRRKPANP